MQVQNKGNNSESYIFGVMPFLNKQFILCFILFFQGLNSAELLRLYIEYDLLEEAVSLCVEYVDSVIETFSGHDSKLFQLKVGT